MKKQIAALLSGVIAAGTLAALTPAAAAEALLYSGFETGTDGWTARGTATVAQATGSAAAGSGALSVTARGNAWAGAGYSLDETKFRPGETYSFSAMVTQTAEVGGMNFKLSLQYSNGGFQSSYDEIASASAAAGMWTKLENTSYTIPAGAANMLLYVETVNSQSDFLLDEVTVGEKGSTVTPPPSNYKRGDADHSGKVDIADVKALRDFLLGKNAEVFLDTADLDSSGKLNAKDLTLLKRLVLNPPAETTAPPQTEPPVETQTEPGPGGNVNPKELMAKVQQEINTNVPNEIKNNKNTGGTPTKITYFSQKAGGEKKANIWVPKGYDSSKKYNVLIMNHGVFGNEDNMTSGWGVTEMASYFIDSGKVPPFIIVFPQMFTGPGGAPGMGSINQQTMDQYDDFIYDLTESLLPYVKEHYSIYTGRDHTAIAGFSMGGRESLYIGINKPDEFGYVCASSPAPGIIPGVDSWLNHAGSYIPGTNRRMTEADFKISDDKLPYLLMIGGGTNDNVVGTFPKSYHETFTKNGTTHVWLEVPGAGHDAGVGTPLFYYFFQHLFGA